MCRLNDVFIRACRRQRVDHTPVWFMRQAGRYLPSYQKIREKHDIMQIVKSPRLASQAATSPVDDLGVDAAIIFSDIMVPVEAMGVSVRIEENEGPIIAHPIVSIRDVESLQSIEPYQQLPNVFDGIELTLKSLDGRVPLIGFSAAPFTLASYLIEGKRSRDFDTTKKLMYSNPDVWHALMNKLTHMITDYLRAQIDAGVHAVQIFDTWVESLSPDDYSEHVLEYSRKIFRSLEGRGVPRIHYSRGSGNLLDRLRNAGGDVFSIDWRVPLDEAWEKLGPDVAVQGNLEPTVLFADTTTLYSKADDVLKRGSSQYGHIFNLGRGVLPGTPVDSVRRLVDYVHEWTRDGRN